MTRKPGKLAEARARAFAMKKRTTRYPLIQVHGANPEGGTLQLGLRADSARFCVYAPGYNTLSIPITPVDFETFVEWGRAQHFGPTEAPITEGPCLEILSNDLPQDYIEVRISPDSVTFAITIPLPDAPTEAHETRVRISPEQFTALIERCRQHQFKDSAK